MRDRRCLLGAGLLLGVWVIVEPPVVSDRTGHSHQADSKAAASQWRQAFPIHFDSQAECDQWRRNAASGRPLKCVAARPGSAAAFTEHAGRHPPKTRLPSERLRSE